LLTSYYIPFIATRATAATTPGQAPTETVIGYYKGFIQPLSSSDTFKLGKNVEDATHRLYTSMSVNTLQKGDRISQGTQNYIVSDDVTQPTGVSSVNHHREILLRFIK